MAAAAGGLTLTVMPTAAGRETGQPASSFFYIAVSKSFYISGTGFA
jgi:hypothetical protein